MTNLLNLAKWCDASSQSIPITFSSLASPLYSLHLHTHLCIINIRTPPSPPIQSHRKQHCYGSRILQGGCFLIPLTSSVVVYGTGKVLTGMTVQGWLFSNERLFTNLTEARTAWTVEKILLTYLKTYYSSALTNKPQLFISSLRGGVVSLHLFRVIFANYLKTTPCINDPPPCYRYLGRKSDFFILDWVGHVFQSPTRQFQNGLSTFWVQIQKKSVGPFYPYMFTEHLPCSLVTKNCLNFPFHFSDPEA